MAEPTARVWRLAMRSQVYAQKKSGGLDLFDWLESGQFVTLADYRALEQLNAELLEALENIENDDGSIPKTIWDMRNAAIAKATGGQ